MKDLRCVMCGLEKYYKNHECYHIIETTRNEPPGTLPTNRVEYSLNNNHLKKSEPLSQKK